MSVAAFDHVAIPIRNIEAMLAFYEGLGFSIDNQYAPRAYSVLFGQNKINFHAPQLWETGNFDLRGPSAKPGCGDFCFVWDGSQDALVFLLAECGATIIEGPISREGGRKVNGTSTYVRDPDDNLLEFMIYD